MAPKAFPLLILARWLFPVRPLQVTGRLQWHLLRSRESRRRRCRHGPAWTSEVEKPFGCIRSVFLKDYMANCISDVHGCIMAFKAFFHGQYLLPTSFF